MEKNQGIFSGPEIIDLCESVIEDHRALKSTGMVLSEFDFDKDNGNAFQGKIRKTWFKSVIDEMVMKQFEKLDRIVEIYKEELVKIENNQ